MKIILRIFNLLGAAMCIFGVYSAFVSSIPYTTLNAIALILSGLCLALLVNNWKELVQELAYWGAMLIIQQAVKFYHPDYIDFINSLITSEFFANYMGRWFTIYMAGMAIVAVGIGIAWIISRFKRR